MKQSSPKNKRTKKTAVKAEPKSNVTRRRVFDFGELAKSFFANPVFIAMFVVSIAVAATAVGSLFMGVRIFKIPSLDITYSTLNATMALATALLVLSYNFLKKRVDPHPLRKSITAIVSVQIPLLIAGFVYYALTRVENEHVMRAVYFAASGSFVLIGITFLYHFHRYSISHIIKSRRYKFSNRPSKKRTEASPSKKNPS